MRTALIWESSSYKWVCAYLWVCLCVWERRVFSIYLLIAPRRSFCRLRGLAAIAADEKACEPISIEASIDCISSCTHARGRTGSHSPSILSIGIQSVPLPPLYVVLLSGPLAKRRVFTREIGSTHVGADSRARAELLRMFWIPSGAYWSSRALPSALI